MNIETIEESIINGQFKQAKKQILQYGQKRFISDIFDYVKNTSVDDIQALYLINKYIKVAI